jgi:hypothetical protein
MQSITLKGVWEREVARRSEVKGRQLMVNRWK